MRIYQLAIDVEYQSDIRALVVVNVPRATSGFELGLKVGDQIVALDDQALPDFFGNSQRRYRIWEAATEYPPLLFPKKLDEWPFPAQQKMFLHSLEARSITVIASHFTTEKPGSAKVIFLEEDLINKSNTSLLTVQLVLALAFWATGFVLTVLRPYLFMTFCFNLFFCFVGAYLLATTVTSFYLDHLIFILLVLSSLVCPISFFYFVLLFPDGKPPARWLRLLSLFLLVIMLIANGLYLFFSLYQTQFALSDGILELLYSIRLKLFSVLSFAALFIITVRSFRAQGLQRAKFKLVTIVLLVVALPPLFFFTGYIFGELWEELVVIYFGLLCLPTVLIPIVMVYAIVRHHLFYPDNLIRSFLSYLLLSVLLSALYFMFATAISFALEKLFAIKNQEFDFLAFVLIALTASRFRVLTQTAVDRVFYRHKLDYAQLLRDWNNKLIFFKDSPAQLFYEITTSLKEAFNYHNLDVFLCVPDKNELYNPANLLYLNNKPSNKPELGEKSGFFPPLIISSANQERPASASFQSPGAASSETLEHRKLVDHLLDYSQLNSLGLHLTELALLQADYGDLFLSTANPSPIYLPASSNPLAVKLTTLGYNFYLPFPSQSNLAGGLLLGDKLSGQTPSLEELTWMLTLSHQVSQALHTAVLVETETVRRHLMQAFFLDQDASGQRERQRIARDLHDTVVQELGFLDKSISDWFLDQQDLGDTQSATKEELSSASYASVMASTVEPVSEPGSTPRIVTSSSSNIPAFMLQVLAINRSVLTQLRGLINQLRPKSIDLGLVVALRRLVRELNQLHREIVFEFGLDLRLEQESYLNYFSSDQIWHIYQIINEAINNGIKHGGGSSIYLKLHLEVKIEQSGKNVTFLIVEILDDGKGFPAAFSLSNLFDQGHFGLVFMQERVNALGGSLSFTRETIDEVYGSVVRAVIPVPEPMPD